MKSPPLAEGGKPGHGGNQELEKNLGTEHASETLEGSCIPWGGGLPGALRVSFIWFEVGPKTQHFLPHASSFQSQLHLKIPGAASKATRAWVTPQRGGILFGLWCSLSTSDFSSCPRDSNRPPC